MCIQKFKDQALFIIQRNALMHSFLISLKDRTWRSAENFFKSKILDRGCDWNVPDSDLKILTTGSTITNVEQR